MDLYVLFECPQTFEVWHGRTAIGTLDLLFVRTKKENFVFILAGKWWIVDEIDYDDAKVFVKPISTAPPPAS
jgi:Lhr-like helicase